MHDLGSDIADVPLTELTIPGTHDMGTYGQTSVVSNDNNSAHCGDDISICGAYAQAQTESAAQELSRGIRYFDLRVCGHGVVTSLGRPVSYDPATFHQDLVTCHALEDAPVADILDQTRQFVDQHPGEVVFLDFNHAFLVNPDLEAQQIEQAFTVPQGCTPGDAGCGSLLIPPQYCNGAKDQGTCADDLTLRKIRDQHLGKVIVNFENDSSTPPQDCFPTSPCLQPSPQLDLAFYDRHPLLWGRVDGPAPTSHGDRCTLEAAFPSCFANVDTIGDTRDRAIETLTNRPTYIDSGRDTGLGVRFKRFFVQFLQTTPDGGTIASDGGRGSLYDEAVGLHGSNEYVGPAVLGCGDSAALTGSCFAQHRPENVNILALNFFEVTDYTYAVGIPLAEASACSGSDRSNCPLTPDQQATVQCSNPTSCSYRVRIHFDLARDAIAFDEYARTAPVVTISSQTSTAASGWYNAATLGGQGHQLKVDVSAEDYKYATGIDALDCLDGAASLPIGFSGPTSASDLSLSSSLADGIHQLDCRASDGADQGLHGAGNRGAGPGSTPLPVSFRVDTTPPVITCPTGSFLLNQPINTLDGTVSDAISGVASPTASTPISTAKVGGFTATLTASDKAGNTASKVCSYMVSYKIATLYDTTRQATSGSTVPIKVALEDYYGNNVSSATITVTAKMVTNTGTGTTLAPTSPGGTTSFAFDTLGTIGYRYNLKTTGYATGSYTLDFVASGDPVTHSAPFKIG